MGIISDEHLSIAMKQSRRNVPFPSVKTIEILEWLADKFQFSFIWHYLLHNPCECINLHFKKHQQITNEVIKKYCFE